MTGTSDVEVTFGADASGVEAGAASASAAVKGYASAVNAAKTPTSQLTASLQALNDTLSEQMASANGAAGALSKTKSGMNEAAQAAERLHFGSSGAIREMLVLAREAGNGNFTRMAGSLALLAQRTGALTMILSPLGLALTATAVAAGGVAWALHQGAQDQVNFANALAATHNWAGITEPELDKLASTLGQQTHVGATQARAALLELVRDGTFTGDNLKLVAQDALLLGRAFGGEASTYIKQFAGLQTQTVETTYKLQQQFHMLTPAVFDHIIAMIKDADATGNFKERQDAIRIVLNSVATGLKDQTENAGYLEKAIRGVVEAFGALIEKIRQWGRDPSDVEKLQKAKEQLAVLQSQANMHGRFQDQARQQLADQIKIVDALQKQVDLSKQKAQADDAAQKRDAPKIDKSFQNYQSSGKEDKSRVGAWEAAFQAAENQAVIASGGVIQNLTADEVAFWSKKLALTRAGTAEQIEVQRRLQTAIAGGLKQNAQEAVTEAGQEKEAAMAAMNAQLEARKAAISEMISAVEREESAKVLSRRAGLAKIIDLINQEKQAEIDANAETYIARVSADQAIASHYATTTAEYKKAMQDEQVAYAAAQAELVRINAQAQAQIRKQTDATNIAVVSDFQKAAMKIGDQWRTTVEGLIEKTTTWQQTCVRLEEQMLDKFLQVVERMAVQYLSGQVAQTAATTAGVGARNAAETAGASKTLAVSLATSLKQIENQAATAAAGAYQAMAGIPIIGPALGAAAAAATFTAVMGFEGLASAAGGWGQIPKDQLAMVHQNEMILPASIASPLRNIIASASVSGLNAASAAAAPLSAVSPFMGGGGGAGGDSHVHINTMDSKGVQRFFDQHSDKLVKTLQRANRTGKAFA